ncbi:hypothetical protein B0T20DRAFT_365310, partial [Sordaria brevicollis]
IYINNIIIFSDIIKEYFKYFDYIFNLFTLYNLILLFKKNYIIYPNVELLGFYIDIFNLSLIKKRLEVFRNLIFPEILKSLEIYISKFNFLRYLIPYYNKLSEPL